MEWLGAERSRSDVEEFRKTYVEEDVADDGVEEDSDSEGSGAREIGAGHGAWSKRAPRKIAGRSSFLTRGSDG